MTETAVLHSRHAVTVRSRPGGSDPPRFKREQVQEDEEASAYPPVLATARRGATREDGRITVGTRAVLLAAAVTIGRSMSADSVIALGVTVVAMVGVRQAPPTSSSPSGHTGAAVGLYGVLR